MLQMLNHYNTHEKSRFSLPERTVLTNPLPALRHQLQHDAEGGLVIVEDDNIVASIG